MLGTRRRFCGPDHPLLPSKIRTGSCGKVSYVTFLRKTKNTRKLHTLLTPNARGEQYVKRKVTDNTLREREMNNMNWE